MSVKTVKRIFFLFLLAGLTVLNYPFISQMVNERSQSTVIRTYQEQVKDLSAEKRKEEAQAARDYNRRLARSASSGIGDPFASGKKADREYQELLQMGDQGMMGYLSIPAISLDIPIYHGTSAKTLELGAGHLQGTSLPVGGKSTHAVISAHSGLPSKLFFTDLDQLEKGDTFFLHVAGEQLAYETDLIQTVEPHETDALKIIPDKDYVTLVTCTPYGVNSHRYFVRGHRIPWEEESVQPDLEIKGKSNTGRWIFAGSAFILLLMAFILLGPVGRKGRTKK